MKKLSPVDEIVQYFGTQQKAAKALGITQPAVANYRKRGIPAHIAIRVERLTKGFFRAIHLYDK